MVLITATAQRTPNLVLPPPSLKAPPHRPTLVRKRDDTDLDLSSDAAPLTSGKRTKVTFDNDVDVRVIGTFEKTPEIIREEVRRALERHAVGDGSGIERLEELFTKKSSMNDALSPASLKSYIAALLPNVSTLSRGLVRAIIKSEWLGRDDKHVALFLRLLASLATTQGLYLRDILGMLVENLKHVPPSSTKLPLNPTITKAELYHRVHSCLRYLLRLIPSASSILLSALSENFPHSSGSKQAHVVFVRNLLRITEYVPELQSEILAFILDRVVKIDVAVQVDLEDLAEDVEEGIVQDLPKLKSGVIEDWENEDEESGDESDSSEDELDVDANRAKDITANMEKLDLMLDILFAYYNPLFSGTSLQAREDIFEVLLLHFATIILPTYRSRHTQFLLFHFAQQQADGVLIDKFVGCCIHLAFDKGRTSIVRRSAAAYLASFVARGVHVPPQIVRDVFGYIGNQLTILRAEYEPTCRGPDLRRYSTYYSLVQALLYIFCFRWRDLQALPDEQADDEGLPIQDDLEYTWIPGIKDTFAQNVISKLNPLKVCSPAIVTEFARIANHLSVIYVFHIIEINKRLRLSFLPHSNSAHDTYQYSQLDRETALSGRRDESHYQLDEYFPFDPYHLPRSKRWVESDYRAWKGVPGLDEEKGGNSDSESESGDEKESEDEEASVTIAGSISP